MSLTLLRSEWPKMYVHVILAFLSAVGLNKLLVLFIMQYKHVYTCSLNFSNVSHALRSSISVK